MGAKIGSSCGQAYVTSPSLFLPLIYLGIKSMGPGRYKEIPAMTSSKFCGRSSFIKLFMPALSNWNMPSVLPVPMESSTALSSKSIWSISRRFPVSFSIISTASLITVRVRSPRKSIFKSPSSSSVVMVNCVVMEPSAPLESGTNSSADFWQITTPAACMEVCLGRPSSLLHISIR